MALDSRRARYPRTLATNQDRKTLITLLHNNSIEEIGGFILCIIIVTGDSSVDTIIKGKSQSDVLRGDTMMLITLAPATFTVLLPSLQL